MKALKAILAVMIIALVAVSFGCSKKKTTEPVTTPTSTTSALPASQTGVADAMVSQNSDMSSQMGTFSGMLSGNKGAKSVPAHWYGPYNGWYYEYYPLDSTTNWTWRYEIRFTPDPWANVGVDPTKIEWKYVFRDTAYYQFTYTGSVEYQNYPADTLHVKGYWRLAMGGQYVHYNWTYNFDNVSIVSGIYDGHYTFDFNYPYSYGANGMVYTHLTGEFKFAVDGTGNLGASNYGGYCASEGLTFVKFYYTSHGHGYYTLVGDGFVHQYPF